MSSPASGVKPVLGLSDGPLKQIMGSEEWSLSLYFFARNAAFEILIIGDFVKTAIGTLLGARTVIDFGSSLFGESIRSGYLKPFTWGKNLNYQRDKFVLDPGRMMARRSREVSPALEQLIALVR